MARPLGCRSSWSGRPRRHGRSGLGAYRRRRSLPAHNAARPVDPGGGLAVDSAGRDGPRLGDRGGNQIASNGALGVIVLPQTVAPMPQSIIASLASIAGGLSGGGQPAPPPPAAAVPTVTLGEDNGCQLIYNGQPAIDRFPYGVFFRLGGAATEHRPGFSMDPILGGVKIPLPTPYENQVRRHIPGTRPTPEPGSRGAAAGDRRLPRPDNGPGCWGNLRQQTRRCRWLRRSVWAMS